jgi:hypothetical protein
MRPVLSERFAPITMPKPLWPLRFVSHGPPPLTVAVAAQRISFALRQYYHRAALPFPLALGPATSTAVVEVVR